MARLESQAVAGYYALPAHLIAPIAGLIAWPERDRHYPRHVHIMDPCAGDGAALYGLLEQWWGPSWHEEHKYSLSTNLAPLHVTPLSIEMEKERHTALTERAKCGKDQGGFYHRPAPIHADALTVSYQMSASLGEPGVSVLYLNPPYETDREHGRMEQAFLAKFTGVLARGLGVLLFVVPHYALRASARTLATSYEQVRCYAFPAQDFAAYKQVVLVARRRDFDLPAPDRDLEKLVLAWAATVDGMPVLGDEQGVYPILRNTSGLSDMHTQDLNVTGVLDRFPSDLDGYDSSVDEMTVRVFPLGMRPREAHIAAAMGAGIFNGVFLDPGKADLPVLLLKAVFTKDWLKTEERTDKKGKVTAHVEVQQPKLNVTALCLDTSQFVTFGHSDSPTGKRDLTEWTIADLLLHYGPSLVQAMDKACPALHDPRRPGEDIPIPATVRTPFKAQREAIQAAIKIAFTGESPYGLGEIGSGKTTLATCMLWALSEPNWAQTWAAVQRADRNRAKNLGVLARSFPRTRKTAVRPVRAALVMCPPHLLQSWQDQCRATIPGAQVVVLDEPADLERVKGLLRPAPARPAPAPVTAPVRPAKPAPKNKSMSLFDQIPTKAAPKDLPGKGLVVALLTRETAKLGHGWAPGLTPGRGMYKTCPRCGTEYDPRTENEIVKKRTRCTGRSVMPANNIARMIVNLSTGGAGLEPGPAVRQVLGTMRFGKRLKGTALPTVDQVRQVMRHGQRAIAAKKDDYGAKDGACTTVGKALFALSMLVDLTPDQAECVAKYLLGLGYWSQSMRQAGLDLYVCKVAPYVDAEHDQAFWRETCGSHTYLSSANFLSGCDGIRAERTGALLSPTGNGPNGNGYSNRIRWHAGKVIHEGLQRPSDWMDKFVEAANGMAVWHVRYCHEPLFQAAGVRRFPLANLISRKYADLFQVVIGDEYHEYNNDGTAQERAFHRLTNLGAMNMGLSGSLMAGYAKQLFRNLWAMSPSFRKEYGYADMPRFCRQFGYYKRLVSADDKKGPAQLEHGAVTDRVQKSMTEEKKLGDAPGFLPVGLIRFILPNAVTMQKSDMVEALPTVDHLLTVANVDKDVSAQFARLVDDLRTEIRKNKYQPDMAGRLLGALAELPSFLDRAALGEFTIRYPENMKTRDGEPMTEAGRVVCSVPGVPYDRVLPKEDMIMNVLRTELAQGRNAIVFVWHTALLDRYARLFAPIGKTVVLSADRVPTSKREAWIDKEVVKAGCRILLVNPATVQTGLNNLTHFSTAIWAENAHCDPTIKRQADGRIDRIGQRLPVKIQTLIYGDSFGICQKMQDLLSAKIVVSRQVDGLDTTAALNMVGGGSGEGSLIAAMNIGKVLAMHLHMED